MDVQSLNRDQIVENNYMVLRETHPQLDCKQIEPKQALTEEALFFADDPASEFWSKNFRFPDEAMLQR